VASRSSVHWPSAAQLAFSGLVLLGSFGIAAALAVMGALEWSHGAGSADQSVTLLVTAVGVGLVGLFALPSAGLALWRLLGRSQPEHWIRLPEPLARRLLILAAIAVLWGAALALGNWAVNQGGIAQLALVLLSAVVVILPIAGYLVVGAGGLAGGSLQRRWGIFSTGLAGTSLVVLVIELLAFALVGGAVLVGLASRPDMMEALNRLVQRLSNAQITPENLGRILRPYMQPWLIYLGAALVAGLAPLLEELLKPLPLWFFARRGLTPAEGFVGGMLAGAGFTLFESMGDLSGIAGQGWVSTAAARAGTDLLHMVTAGLMGWALALAWGEGGRRGRFLRLALTYVLVVGVHALWNSMSVVMVALPLALQADSPLLSGALAQSLPVAVLAVIYLGLFAAMLWANQRLNKRIPPENPVPASVPGTFAEQSDWLSGRE
jgi:hypothetical protein